MKKEDLTSIPGLSEEQIEKIIAVSETELKTYIPKTRFDEVNERMKKAETTVTERDSQIEQLGKNTGDIEALRTKITELAEQNTKAMQEKEAEIKQIKIDNAINDALKNANAKNLKAVRALLNLENPDFNEDGTIKGLSKQLKTLQESEESNFLFGSSDATTKTTTIAGATPASTGAKSTTPGTITKEQFNMMGYKERVDLFNSDRELYDSLSN